MALGVILIAQVMILLDATVVNVALPSAQADLGFSNAARPWVVTAYLLAFGSLLPLGGRLADAYGRKTMFIVGLVGFAIASAVGGAAPNIATLIAARAVQGGFAALLAPAALSLITVIFTDMKDLNKAFGVFGAVAGSSAALGLMLGGLLTDYVNWRWCMYVNIAFAIVGIIGGVALLHNSTEPNKPKLSVSSTILGAAAIFGVVFGSAKAQTDGWSSPVTLIPLIAGALLLIGFVVLQRVDRHPLIPLHVLADRNRGAAYLTLLLGQGGVFALFLFLTYYFQDVLHYSPIKTGVAFLPMMLTVVVVATLTQSVLVRHLTMRAITVAGLLISGAGAALLTQADAGSPYAAWVLPGLILIGAGIGSAIVSAVAAGQQGVDPRDAGTAGAVNNVVPAARRGPRRRRHQHLRRHRHQPLPDRPRQHRRRRRHRARVHRRLLVGRRPVLGGCGHLRCPHPRRHQAPPGGRPARAPRRDQRAVLRPHVPRGAVGPHRIAAPPTRPKTVTTN